MKKNIFRVFFCMFILLLVILIKSDVQAMTFTYSDVEYNLPDLLEDGENFNSNYYSIFKIDGEYTLLSYTGYDPSTMKIVNTNEISGSVAIVDLEGNVVEDARIWFWHSDGSCDWYIEDWQPNRSYYGYYLGQEKSDKFICSSCTIYLAAGSDSGSYEISSEIFFPQTTLLLPPIMEKQEGAMKTTLQEILNILPMILVVVVSYLGLRKALIMLQEVFRKA